MFFSSFTINNISDRFARSPLDEPAVPTVQIHFQVERPLDSFQKPVTQSVLASFSVVFD